MIAYLRGSVASVEQSFAVIDVSGVGYKVFMAVKDLQLLRSGEPSLIHTSYQQRDDSVTLYGFLKNTSTEMFEKLLGVSGVGPKVALAFLSLYTSEEITSLIFKEDVQSLSAVPGIGKKTASRVVLELKGKLVPLDGIDAGVGTAVGSPATEAIAALMSMGFSNEEAKLALKGYDGSDKAEELLKYALSRLGK
jgi:Holliday junction DNA helicase RuvA